MRAPRDSHLPCCRERAGKLRHQHTLGSAEHQKKESGYKMMGPHTNLGVIVRLSLFEIPLPEHGHFTEATDTRRSSGRRRVPSVLRRSTERGERWASCRARKRPCARGPRALLSYE